MRLRRKSLREKAQEGEGKERKREDSPGHDLCELDQTSDNRITRSSWCSCCVHLRVAAHLLRNSISERNLFLNLARNRKIRKFDVRTSRATARTQSNTQELWTQQKQVKQWARVMVCFKIRESVLYFPNYFYCRGWDRKRGRRGGRKQYVSHHHKRMKRDIISSIFL